MPRRWLSPHCRTARAAVALAVAVALSLPALAARPGDPNAPIVAPAPRPAERPRAQPTTPVTIPTVSAQADRLKRLTAVRSWGYQLAGLNVATAAQAPYDLLVIDRTTGLDSNRPIRLDEVERLKRKPDGGRRLVVGYLSIGEAEDYRPDYFATDYLSEEAPDWLGPENAQWRGNRIVRFCQEGWQRTILGDDDGRNVYNSIEPSPLYRLVELGFDGIYLDRADVYSEVTKECPNGDKAMVWFIQRIAAHARKRNPAFMVILQNAEELVRVPKLVDAIDAIAKEDLFFGVGHSQRANDPGMVETILGNLKIVKASGRPVFVVDYVLEAGKKAEAKRRIEAQGFIPYIGPRNLGQLWLPGRDF